MSARPARRAAGSSSEGGPEDRRATILDATLRLIAAEGVDAVTHRRVAAAAGVPLGSTTYYFASREHLLREAFRRYLAQVQAQLARTGKAFHDAPTVAGLVDHLVETTRRGFEDEALMLAEYELTLFAARDAEVAEALHAWDALVISRLAQSLEQIGTPQPFDVARTLLQLIRGHELDSLSRHDANPDDLRRRLQRVVAALVDDAPSQPVEGTPAIANAASPRAPRTPRARRKR